jgi:peptidoglycan L-alanyl-D-glutamate endopeptidase CwlK
MKERVEKFLEKCEKAGLRILIVETRRSKARQLFLYAMGRVISPALEQRYLGYDDPAIYSKPGEKKVTWTLNSRHMYGKAIDFCFLDKDGQASGS